MEVAVATVKQTKDSEVKQRIQDIQMLVSWREIAHTYFGKSASWLYHKLDGIDGNGGVGGFTEDEKNIKMRRGLIIPHKTKVAIALWRRNTKNVPDTEPCRGLLIVHIKTFFYYGLFRKTDESGRCYD